MTVVPTQATVSLPAHMKYVVGGGASGGFISWVYSETIGTKLSLPIAAAIGACIVLGAAAALISVYIIANSDVNNLPRLIVFALISGVFWKPVLDSSITYVNQKQDAASADRRSTAALDSLQSAPSTAQPANVAAATRATTDLLKTSDRLEDPDLKKKAEARTDELITTLSKTGTANPESAAAALSDVKSAAESTGNTALAARAQTEMSKLEVLSERNPRVRPEVAQPARPDRFRARPDFTATMATTATSP